MSEQQTERRGCWECGNMNCHSVTDVESDDFLSPSERSPERHEFEVPVRIGGFRYHDTEHIPPPLDRCVALLRGTKGVRSCGQPRDAEVHQVG